jgi:hypothetical protein
MIPAICDDSLTVYVSGGVSSLFGCERAILPIMAASNVHNNYLIYLVNCTFCQFYSKGIKCNMMILTNSFIILYHVCSSSIPLSKISQLSVPSEWSVFLIPTEGILGTNHGLELGAFPQLLQT